MRVQNIKKTFLIEFFICSELDAFALLWAINSTNARVSS